MTSRSTTALVGRSESNARIRGSGTSRPRRRQRSGTRPGDILNGTHLAIDLTHAHQHACVARGRAAREPSRAHYLDAPAEWRIATQLHPTRILERSPRATCNTDGQPDRGQRVPPRRFTVDQEFRGAHHEGSDAMPAGLRALERSCARLAPSSASFRRMRRPIRSSRFAAGRVRRNGAS
jgi:hypothetical protein